MNEKTPEISPNGLSSRTPVDDFEKGRSAENAGHFEEACSAYELALEGAGHMHFWHYRLGCVHMKWGQPQAAEVCFLRSLELAPNTVAYLTNYGVALDRQGRRDDATRAYRKATLQDRGSPVAFHNLGSIYAEQGRTDEAIRAFQAAIALEPDAEGYHNLGLVHYNGGDFLQALSCFERSTEYDQNFALGQYYVALCLLKQGMYENAAVKFELSWKLDNRLVRVSYHLGVCLHKLARYEKARDSLLEALDFFPEDGRVHYQLALTCDALGMPQEARHHYGQARAARVSGRPS